MKVNPEIVVKLAADSFEKLNAYPAEPLSVMFVDPAPAPVMVKPLPDVVIPVVTVKDPAATLIVSPAVALVMHVWMLGSSAVAFQVGLDPIQAASASSYPPRPQPIMRLAMSRRKIRIGTQSSPYEGTGIERGLPVWVCAVRIMVINEKDGCSGRPRETGFHLCQRHSRGSVPAIRHRLPLQASVSYTAGGGRTEQ